MMSYGYSRFTRHGRHGFGIMSRSGRFFGPGEVRLALLSLLTEAPVHGYELMKRLEERSGGVYRASAGTVYPTLQQLEDEGLINSESHEGKKVYRLTDEGERETRGQRRGRQGESGGAPGDGRTGAAPSIPTRPR